MTNQRFRVAVPSVLLASSVSAQVLAGLTAWQALWLLVTFVTTGTRAALGFRAGLQVKKAMLPKTLVSAHVDEHRIIRHVGGFPTALGGGRFLGSACHCYRFVVRDRRC